MSKVLFTAIAALFVFTSCLKDNKDFKCDYDPCQFKAPAAEIQAVQQYLTDNGITASQHCSGLFYKIVEPGTGVTPEACSNVNVSYVGKFTNGTVFDETEGNETVSFSLGQVIIGWANGVPLIKEGGKILLYVPPSLGYGSQDYQGIPGNSILVFEVSLHHVL